MYFIDKCVDTGLFPDISKYTNITPASKIGYRDPKVNYCPVTILAVISKMLEKILSIQIISFKDQFFVKNKCAIRKGDSAQHCRLSLLKKWKHAIDKEKVFGHYLRISQRCLTVFHKD